MADLNIPNLNKKSEKYIFKKKIPLRRKSIKKLFAEFAFMFILSFFLIYIIYLIPNKSFLLQKLPTNLNKSIELIIAFGSGLYEILLVIFIFLALVISLILFIGSLYRLFRIFNRKSKKISYK